MRKFPWLPVVIALGLLGGIVLFWDTSEKKAGATNSRHQGQYD